MKKGWMTLVISISAVVVLLGSVVLGTGPTPVVEATTNCIGGASWVHTDYPYDDRPWLVEKCLKPGNDREFPLWELTPTQVPPEGTRVNEGQLVALGTSGSFVLDSSGQSIECNNRWFWAPGPGTAYDTGMGTSSWLDPNKWRISQNYCQNAQPPVAPRPPQSAPQYACNNGRDDDNDGLVDAGDPGCHSDGNAGNPNSYVWWDVDEWNSTPPSSGYPVTNPSSPLTPAEVQSWCRGDCPIWRFTQLIEANGCVNQHGVKMNNGAWVTLLVPAGTTIDYWNGSFAVHGVAGPVSVWTNAASLRHIGHICGVS